MDLALCEYKQDWVTLFKPVFFFASSCSGYNGAVTCFCAFIGVGHVSRDRSIETVEILGILGSCSAQCDVNTSSSASVLRSIGLEHTNSQLVLHTLSPWWLTKTQYAAISQFHGPGA